MVNGEALSENERRAIENGLQELEQGLIGFAHPAIFLREFRARYVQEPPVRYCLMEPDWMIAMSGDFRKATRNIDRKLQGRIFQAISHVSTQPITPKGNTVKPLTGDWDGFWRYRIGEFRLIYLPNTKTRNITLVSFSGRGDVYG